MIMLLFCAFFAADIHGLQSDDWRERAKAEESLTWKMPASRPVLMFLSHSKCPEVRRRAQSALARNLRYRWDQVWTARHGRIWPMIDQLPPEWKGRDCVRTRWLYRGNYSGPTGADSDWAEYRYATQRWVIHLIYYEGRDPQEVLDLLAVMDRWYRALDKDGSYFPDSRNKIRPAGMPHLAGWK